MDEILRQLRAEWAAKHAEAEGLARKDNATGPEITQAEKLFDECDGLKGRIEERQAELGRKAALLDRAKTGTAWDSEPSRTVPFSTSAGDTNKGQSQFSLAGFAPAGHAVINEARELVSEAGPGQFGEKTWELMKSIEYKRDFYQYLRKGTRHLDRCVKTLLEGLDDQGGVFAPAELLMNIIGRLPAPTELRSYVTQLTTGRDTILMPRKQYSADDKYTTAFRATWTGEQPASDTAALVTDSALLGNVEIPVHTAMLVGSFSKNLFEDSAFPIQSWLQKEFNEIIDLLYEDMILNGTGIGQPTGIQQNQGTTNRPAVVLSGSAGALAYDGLIDLMTSLPPQYDKNGRFVLNKTSAYRALLKIKDSQNRPLFARGVTEDGLASQRGMELLGYPVTFSSFMPDVSSMTYPVLFGDLKGYYLVNRIGFAIQVLDQTKAKQNQLELVGRIRFGGAPIEYWRMKLQKSNNA